MPSDKILIKKARSSDVDALVDIERNCFAEEAFSRRQLSYLVTRAKGVCFVATHHSQAVGYVSLLHRSDSSCLRIYSIAVHTAGRGCGVGQRLITESISYAKTCGLTKITLEVKVSNIPAQTLYSRFGFQQVKLLSSYYEDGTSAFRMELKL